MSNIGLYLPQPEAGWYRYSCIDSKIELDNMVHLSNGNFYGGNFYVQQNMYLPAYVKFWFKGSKIRLLDQIHTNRVRDTVIVIDDSLTEPCSSYATSNYPRGSYLYYEKTNLEYDYHSVTIFSPSQNTNTVAFGFECVDLDGELLYKDDYIETLRTYLICENDEFKSISGNNLLLVSDYKYELLQKYDDTLCIKDLNDISSKLNLIVSKFNIIKRQK